MIRFKGYPGLEFATPESMRAIQSARLKQHLSYCARHSPYYQRLFKQAGIRCRPIGLDNLATLPLTDKTDFAKHNDEFLAVPPEDIVDIVLSSGSTGKPTR